jgi:hypothetical protein
MLVHHHDCGLFQSVVADKTSIPVSSLLAQAQLDGVYDGPRSNTTGLNIQERRSML